MQSTSGLVLQVLGVFLGGSAVQLLIFLLRRRAEIKELDKKADAVALDASNNLITRLQQEAEQLRKQIEYMRAEQFRDIEEMTRRLNATLEENARLQREVASLRSEIAIAQRQIEQLSPGAFSPYMGAHRRDKD